MITTKQRAELRGYANSLDPVYFIGKDGITDALIGGVGEVLTARELIKLSIQENSPVTPREACQALCEALGAEPVQVIGRKFVIYKRNKKLNRYGI